MEPLFAIKIVQNTNWWEVGTQIFSAASIFIASIYVGTYPIRKNRREEKNRITFFLGRFKVLRRKLEFIERYIISKGEAYSNIDVQVILGFVDRLRIVDDISFITEHEEAICNFVPEGITPSDLVVDIQILSSSISEGPSEILGLKKFFEQTMSSSTKITKDLKLIIKHMSSLIQKKKDRKKRIRPK